MGPFGPARSTLGPGDVGAFAGTDADDLAGLDEWRHAGLRAGVESRLHSAMKDTGPLKRLNTLGAKKKGLRRMVAALDESNLPRVYVLERFSPTQPGDQDRANAGQSRGARGRDRCGQRVRDQNVPGDRAVLGRGDGIEIGRGEACVPELTGHSTAFREDVAPDRDSRAVEIDRHNFSGDILELDSEEGLRDVEVSVELAVQLRIVVLDGRTRVPDVAGGEVRGRFDKQMADLALHIGAVEFIVIAPGQIGVLRNGPTEGDGIRGGSPPAGPHKAAIGRGKAAGIRRRNGLDDSAQGPGHTQRHHTSVHHVTTPKDYLAFRSGQRMMFSVLLTDPQC